MEQWQAPAQCSSAPTLHYFNRMRLTACRSVSCYAVSAGRIALVGRVLEDRPLKRMNALLRRAGMFLLQLK